MKFAFLAFVAFEVSADHGSRDSLILNQWFDLLNFEECELELTTGPVRGKSISLGNQKDGYETFEIYRGI